MALISMKGMVTTLKADVYAMQSEITKLAQVLTEMAVANNRLNRVEEDIRELKHYKGFVNVDPPACLDMNCPVRRPPSK
jgi:prefoldin subunit 5